MIALRVAWKPPIHGGGYSLEVFRGKGSSYYDAKLDAWTEWFGWTGQPRQTEKIEVVTSGVDASDDDNPPSVTRCWSGDVPADVRAWPSNGSYSMAAYAQWAGMSWEQSEKSSEVDAKNPNCLVWEIGEALDSNRTRYNGWTWRPAATNSSTQSCRIELQGREQIQTSDGWELGQPFAMAMAKDNICGPQTYAQSNAEKSLLARAPSGFQQKQFVGACWKTGTAKPDQPSDWSDKDGAW
jgi:hypothetical protein